MKIMKAYKLRNLRPKDWDVVRVLAVRYGGEYGPGEVFKLAHEMNWDSPNLHRSLRRLESFGVIEIERQGRYVGKIKITEEWR